jgi:hypothetical protein
MEKVECKDCKFRDEDKDCKRYPPAGGFFPLVKDWDWCGEGKKK